MSESDREITSLNAEGNTSSGLECLGSMVIDGGLTARTGHGIPAGFSLSSGDGEGNDLDGLVDGHGVRSAEP